MISVCADHAGSAPASCASDVPQGRSRRLCRCQVVAAGGTSAMGWMLAAVTQQTQRHRECCEWNTL